MTNMYLINKHKVVVKQLKLQMKINYEKDDLTPEELKEYRMVLQTMSSISEALKWDNDKHKVRIQCILFQAYFVFVCDLTEDCLV
jgi:hypothetical protein